MNAQKMEINRSQICCFRSFVRRSFVPSFVVVAVRRSSFVVRRSSFFPSFVVVRRSFVLGVTALSLSLSCFFRSRVRCGLIAAEKFKNAFMPIHGANDAEPRRPSRRHRRRAFETMLTAETPPATRRHCAWLFVP